jgi:hypothetical protein
MDLLRLKTVHAERGLSAKGTIPAPFQIQLRNPVNAIGRSSRENRWRGRLAAIASYSSGFNAVHNGRFCRSQRRSLAPRSSPSGPAFSYIKKSPRSPTIPRISRIKCSVIGVPLSTRDQRLRCPGRSLKVTGHRSLGTGSPCRARGHT